MNPCRRIAAPARYLGLALLLSAGLTGTSSAQFVHTGTGCLRLATGVITKIKVGPTPLFPCAAGEVVAPLSSGDITGVATPAAGGLAGGSNNGEMILSLQTGFRLPQTCSPGQVPSWNGTSWDCSTPSQGGGGGGGGPDRLEDLAGLPCGDGNDAGTVALAINPLSRTVSLACPRLGQFQLEVAVGGPGNVTSVTPEIDCGSGGSACSHAYDGGEVVTLSAAHAAEVAVFQGWGGACSGNALTCEVTMDQARQVTAIFLPTLKVDLVTTATERRTSCAFGICFTFDHFTDSKARVTVTDVETGLVAGTCDADTTLAVPPPTFPLDPPLSTATTTCLIPVVPGHHLRLEAEDSTTLGGTQVFLQWGPGGCQDSTDTVCEPAAAVTVFDETTALFARSN